VFYPQDIKDADQLSYYLQSFSTVELNNSFYRTPTAITFKKWKESVPHNFRFAVKANRFLTHSKKLHDVGDTAVDFISKASHLGENLGPILFQLPPRWRVNRGRLETFLSKLPKGYRYTFEFRDPSWYTAEIFTSLRNHQCAFCIYDLSGHQSPIETTADFVYIRLHGPADKYQGSYTDDSLATWAARCQAWRKDGKDVYFYFDNDQCGYAAFNALTLKKLVVNDN